MKFEDGRFGLLRVADLTAFEGKRSEFSLMQKLAAKGCPISQPLDFWTDTSYVYSVFEWLDGQEMIGFVQTNRHLLTQRPIVYQHGDFHTGNFLLGTDRHLKVLDFDRHDIGDPWEEFNRMIFTASLSPALACGQIDSYFEENIPEKFWTMLALYLTVNSLGALSWAEKVDPDQIPLMKEQAELVGHWFSGYKTIVPTWYSK